MLPCRKEVAISKLTAVQNYGNLAGNFVGSLSLENGLRGKNILWGHRSLLADDDGGNISDDPCSSKVWLCNFFFLLMYLVSSIHTV